MKHLIVLFAVYCLIDCVKLPPNFFKCNRKDPDWKECVFKAGIDGLHQLNKPFPELNIPNLEPFFIPEVTIPGSGVVQITQYFKNAELYGLRVVNATKFEFDFDKKTIELEGTFPEVRMPGEYKFDGRILLLPIVGEGKGETTIKNLHVKMTLPYEEVKRKRKTYIKVVSGELKMVPRRIYFKFDNLFNGDKTLGDNINQVMNDNWDAVFKDIEESYTELVLKVFTTLINGFFSKISIEEAFD